jgi:CelD/BcsL family acetyltransferase involved in cellulose biosynthesis
VFQEPGEVASALERFFVLHRERSELSGTIKHVDVFETPMARRFLKDVCERFAYEGRLRIFALKLGDRLAAMRIGFVLGDSLYLYYSGYEPEFGKYSVATAVVAEAIKYAIAAGFATVNLSFGRDVSKTRWRPEEIVYCEAYVVSPSRRAKLTHAVFDRTRRLIESAPLRDVAARVLGRRSR